MRLKCTTTIVPILENDLRRILKVLELRDKQVSEGGSYSGLYIFKKSYR